MLTFFRPDQALVDYFHVRNITIEIPVDASIRCLPDSECTEDQKREYALYRAKIAAKDELLKRRSVAARSAVAGFIAGATIPPAILFVLGACVFWVVRGFLGSRPGG